MKTLIWECLGGVGDVFRSQKIVHDLIKDRQYTNLIISGYFKKEVYSFVQLVMLLDGINIPVAPHKGTSYEGMENYNILTIGNCTYGQYLGEGIEDVLGFGFRDHFNKKIFVEIGENAAEKNVDLVCLFNSTAQFEDFGSDEYFRTKENCASLELIKKIIDKKIKEDCLFLVNTESEYRYALKFGIPTDRIIIFEGFVQLATLFNMCRSILFVSNSGMHHFYGNYITNKCKVTCLTSDRDYRHYGYNDVEYIIFKKGRSRDLKWAMTIDEIMNAI